MPLANHTRTHCNATPAGHVPAQGRCFHAQSVRSVSLGSRCYVFLAQKMSFLKAESHCRSLEGHLPVIYGNTDNDFVRREAVLAGVETYWLGLNARKKYGAWDWTDRNKCRWFRHWSWTENAEGGVTEAEPLRDSTAHVTENCAFVSATKESLGSWSSANCESSSLNVVCERPTSQGATSTEKCRKGTYARVGDLECRACEWGRYAASRGQSECTACPTFSPARLQAEWFNGPNIHRATSGGSVRCSGSVGRRQRTAYGFAIALAIAFPLVYVGLLLVAVEAVRRRPAYWRSWAYWGGPVYYTFCFWLVLILMLSGLGLAGGSLAHWLAPFVVSISDSPNFGTGRRTATSLDRGCDPNATHAYLVMGLTFWAFASVLVGLYVPVPRRAAFAACVEALQSTVVKRRLRRQVEIAFHEWQRRRDKDLHFHGSTEESSSKLRSSEATKTARKSWSPKCTLCGSKRASALNVPCTHQLLCWECAEAFRKEAGGICHVCREPSTLVDAVTRRKHTADSIRRKGMALPLSLLRKFADDHKVFTTLGSSQDDDDDDARRALVDALVTTAPDALLGADTTDDFRRSRSSSGDYEQEEELFVRLVREHDNPGNKRLSIRELNGLLGQVTQGRALTEARQLATSCAMCGWNKDLVVDTPCGHVSLCRPCSETFRSRHGDACSRCYRPSVICAPIKKQVCSVCCDQVPAERLVTLDVCGHTTCTGCGADFVRSALNDVAGQIAGTGLRCPLRPTGCAGIVHLSTIRRLVVMPPADDAVPITEEEFARIERFVAEATIPEDQRFYCCYPDCARVFAVDRAQLTSTFTWSPLGRRSRLTRKARVVPTDAAGLKSSPPPFVTCVYCQRQSCLACLIPAHTML